jgi:hypothetical protein
MNHTTAKPYNKGQQYNEPTAISTTQLPNHIIKDVVDFYYLVWQLCGWYCWGFVILLTFIIWSGSCVVDIAEGSLYCWPLLYCLAVVWLISLSNINHTTAKQYNKGQQYNEPSAISTTQLPNQIVKVNNITNPQQYLDLYYMVWQLCGWYCWGFVILLTFIIWFGSCVVDIAEGSRTLSNINHTTAKPYNKGQQYNEPSAISTTQLSNQIISCVVDIAEGSLYCWPLLYGLAVVWLILLRVRYIVDLYYMVWQLCGWY